MSKLKIRRPAVFAACIFFFPILICAQETNAEKSFLNKARKVQAAEYSVPAQEERNMDYDPAYSNSVSSSTLSLIRTGKEPAYEHESPTGRPEEVVNTDKPSASSSITNPQFKKAAPAVKEPGRNIKWIDSSTRNFTIKVEPQTTGIMTPNLGMKFETIHQVLGKNISWMMSGKAKVYVYQNRQSFLNNEPVASSWSGAFFSPEDDRIVMYDEPKNTAKMIDQFSHELTHLFVEEFFNPPSDGYKLEPPIWLNEGLAVNMEDIASNTKGGVWASDLVVINIISQGDKRGLIARLRSGQGLSDAEKRAAAANMVSTKVVSFVNFTDFVKNSSFDIAERKGDVENWYFQAYAMVRFLFRPKNGTYPEKRMQFEQFTKLMKTFESKKDSNGKEMRDANGKVIKKRVSTEAALRKAYGFKDMKDFETKFWKWLVQMQKEERERLRRQA